jgi:hypothetical protein
MTRNFVGLLWRERFGISNEAEVEPSSRVTAHGTEANGGTASAY